MFGREALQCRDASLKRALLPAPEAAATPRVIGVTAVPLPAALPLPHSGMVGLAASTNVGAPSAKVSYVDLDISTDKDLQHPLWTH